ncbi:MAG TPA: iron ABC transporter substrate-binding protein [Ruminococcus sp.]|nr:iron ABC transporter substrate-binding protein [Ruminococcus sp.]
MKKAAILLSAVILITTASCGGKSESSQPADGSAVTGHMELEYADQFSVSYLEDGCSVIDIGSDSYLLVPEGVQEQDTGKYTAVIHQPVENIYLASSSAMDPFCAIGGLGSVALTSTDERSWSIPEAAKAIEDGSITYIGKYSTPDYEALVESDCGLAIENTMIYHSPETREKIEQLGVPVLVERSSYESHPLGRMEWVKLYGLLSGRYEEAESFFSEKNAAFEAVKSQYIPDGERKTVAFFYLSSSGSVVIRKPGDYVSKMIELAGGEYVFTSEELGVEDEDLSTMNIQTETFYSLARDADILIYNCSIDGIPDSVSQLTGRCGVLEDFKAVKEGRVYCTERNMFQQITGAADMMIDINRVIREEDENSMTYLHRLS